MYTLSVKLHSVCVNCDFITLCIFTHTKCTQCVVLHTVCIYVYTHIVEDYNNTHLFVKLLCV